MIMANVKNHTKEILPRELAQKDLVFYLIASDLLYVLLSFSITINEEVVDVDAALSRSILNFKFNFNNIPKRKK